jgi:hypothetical protein
MTSVASLDPPTHAGWLTKQVRYARQRIARPVARESAHAKTKEEKRKIIFFLFCNRFFFSLSLALSQGGSIKTWKKRWMVLKGTTLYYFKTKKVPFFFRSLHISSHISSHIFTHISLSTSSHDKLFLKKGKR